MQLGTSALDSDNCFICLQVTTYKLVFLKYWTHARAEVQEAVTAESASTVFVEFLSLSLIMKIALQTVMEVSAYIIHLKSDPTRVSLWKLILS